MANFTTVNTTGMGGGAAQFAVGAAYHGLILVHNTSLSINLSNFSSLVSTLRQAKLYDLLVGTNGTPADNYMEWDVTRVTAGASTNANLAGALSTISTSFYLDLGAVGGGTPQQININSSIETQYTPTVEVWYVGVNQRASYRWVAAPGSEMVWPANTSAQGNNGLLGRTRSAAYTGTATMNWLWQEQ